MKGMHAISSDRSIMDVEVLPMSWRKQDLWIAGTVLVGMLLLLVLMVWLPISSVAAQQQGASATPVTGVTITVQATPSEDATVTALNKEKLAQEVQQLKEQNAPDFFGWLRTNAAILLSTLVVVIGGLIGLFRWFGDRRNERMKQAEERFQSAVTGLGEEKEGARIGAAILLRTFLRPGYEQFYTQTFDLAVAHLRLPRTPRPGDDPTSAQPLTTLSQALIVVFKEAFPLARGQSKGSSQSLDATGIQLDNAYLEGADLKQAWLPKACLQGANLWGADLSGAILWRANLTGAELKGANLSGTDLWEANLSRANLSRTTLEEVRSLKGVHLRGAKGLTKEQLEACKAKGAIIDEDPTTNASQLVVVPPSAEQSNDAQAPLASSAQGPPPSDTDMSNATSPQQEAES
jgi:uncharacterized protein YjbI with pentapeptide repeats